jgi:hypothetical protein
MQHLLLALSIITLTLIAGNEQREASIDNSNMIRKTEAPKVNDADDEFPIDQPSTYFSRFDLFLN